MARSIKCPHCGQVMRLGDEAAGKRVDCPACKKAFRAPQAPAVVAADKPTEAGGPPPVTPAPARVWYFHVDGRNDGPHTAETIAEQVKTGRIDQHTLVWRQGMADWQPIGEVAEFKGAFATPPPVHHASLRKPHHGPRPPRPDQEREPRIHYSRARAGRDVVAGLWVAGALALAAVVALVVVLSRKDNVPAPKPAPTVPVVEQPPVPYPGTPSAPVTPTPKVSTSAAPKKVARPEISNAALLASVVAELDKGFKAAIEGHKKANAKPILALTQKCKSLAEKLAGRDWGAYKSEVDSLAKRLQEAGTGLLSVLRERSQAWGLGEGLDEKKKAEILELDKYEWLTNWQKILADEVEKIRKKGLDF